MLFHGQCHCGAIHVELATERPPEQQILGACQCSFCRKHNARALSDAKAHVTLTAADPPALQRYAFGLRTAEQIICRRCGVYVAMTLAEEERVWSVINVDALDDRALFSRPPEPRDYSAEDRAGRIARRKARWCPTTLVGWPSPRA
jgi:hypothetical protein